MSRVLLATRTRCRCLPRNASLRPPCRPHPQLHLHATARRLPRQPSRRLPTTCCHLPCASSLTPACLSLLAYAWLGCREELNRPENKALAPLVEKLRQAKAAIDASANEGQGPLSWADTIVLAAKVGGQRKACGGGCTAAGARNSPTSKFQRVFKRYSNSIHLPAEVC